MRAVILEPNARPGFTNRVLRPFVDAAACAYEEARASFGGKGVLTGNPVRGGFAALPEKPHREPLTLLVFGGSQGSRVLNEALVAALPRLPGAGAAAHRAPDRRRDARGGRGGLRARPAARPRWPASSTTWRGACGEADLVLCRSGATTCAELTVAGKAAILVPFAARGRRPPDDERARARGRGRGA